MMSAKHQAYLLAHPSTKPRRFLIKQLPHRVPNDSSSPCASGSYHTKQQSVRPLLNLAGIHRQQKTTTRNISPLNSY